MPKTTFARRIAAILLIAVGMTGDMSASPIGRSEISLTTPIPSGPSQGALNSAASCAQTIFANFSGTTSLAPFVEGRPGQFGDGDRPPLVVYVDAQGDTYIYVYYEVLRQDLRFGPYGSWGDTWHQNHLCAAMLHELFHACLRNEGAPTPEDGSIEEVCEELWAHQSTLDAL